MRNFLLGGAILLFLPSLAQAAEYGALAAGVATSSEGGSAAAGVGYGNTPSEAKKEAVNQCADQYTKVQVWCEVIDTFSCGGSGYVTTGIGREENGLAAASWGAGPNPVHARTMALVKLRELGVYDNYNIKDPIGGETDFCE